MTDFVFTYWEGEPYAFTQLCIDSITRIFKDRHVHLTPSSITDWVDINQTVMKCDHISFRSDYIRTLLLQKYGGWWFDCDVILYKDPSELVDDTRPKIWNLIYWYNERWMPLINNGILFTPPSTEWINRILEDFKKIDATNLKITHENEDIGQNIYEYHSVNTGLALIGNEFDFNSTYNVNADYKPFWDGRIKLESANYGIHIGASLSRWAAKQGDQNAWKIITKKSLGELIVLFPQSVVSQYLNRMRESNK
jgi:hypothetical protein